MSNWKSKLQYMNDSMVRELKFPQNPSNFVAGLAAESGEVCDLVARLEGWKKVKSTDTNYKDILKGDLSSEIADVLVYLLQIASMYDIDVQEALESKIQIIMGRKFHS